MSLDKAGEQAPGRRQNRPPGELRHLPAPVAQRGNGDGKGVHLGQYHRRQHPVPPGQSHQGSHPCGQRRTGVQARGQAGRNDSG